MSLLVLRYSYAPISKKGERPLPVLGTSGSSYLGLPSLSVVGVPSEVPASIAGLLAESVKSCVDTFFRRGSAKMEFWSNPKRDLNSL